LAITLRVLTSGSSSNAALVRIGNTLVLLDAGGMSYRQLCHRIAQAGLTPRAVKAIFVSHLHADHLSQAGKIFSRKHRVPIYTHRDNLGLLEPNGAEVIGFDNKALTLGSGGYALPFEVPHDAEGMTCGFSFFSQGCKLTVATDLGYFEEGMEANFKNSDLIMLEANHDESLLEACTKLTQATKQRIASSVGHLSNTQAAEALLRIMSASQKLPRLILLAHLSADRNSPQLALETVRNALSQAGYGHIQIEAAPRDEGTPTFRLSEPQTLTLLE